MSNKKTVEKSQVNIVFPHLIKSAPVTEKNIGIVREQADLMFDLLERMHGKKGAPKATYALAHAQVSKTPLTFFVLNFYLPLIKDQCAGILPPLIINPQIVRHNSVAQLKDEGCASFPIHPMIKTPRYHKGEVSFESAISVSMESERWDDLPTFNHVPLRGLLFQIFQHEIDHMDGKYIRVIDEAYPKE